MNIKTKFNIGDIIWVCNSKYIPEKNKCKKCGHSAGEFMYVPEKYKIAEIDIFISEEGNNITYYTKRDSSFPEDDCFLTKQECQKQCSKLNKEK
jgi:hypothetical protein